MGMFSLPEKKTLLKTENEFEVILIDVTESAIERSKKTKEKISYKGINKSK
jgi:hypothetical protein